MKKYKSCLFSNKTVDPTGLDFFLSSLNQFDFNQAFVLKSAPSHRPLVFLNLSDFHLETLQRSHIPDMDLESEILILIQEWLHLKKIKKNIIIL